MQKNSFRSEKLQNEKNNSNWQMKKKKAKLQTKF